MLGRISSLRPRSGQADGFESMGMSGDGRGYRHALGIQQSPIGRKGRDKARTPCIAVGSKV